MASLPKQPWTLTVLRAQGLQFLRPEKSWRPIISIFVDSHQTHEVALGSDGQNPNLKAAFTLEAHEGTRVELKVWHKSQSKKKGKRRNLVAHADLPLGELKRKHGHDAKLEIRLNSVNTITRRMRDQKCGACVHIHLCTPDADAAFTEPTLVDDEHYLSEAGFSNLSESLLSHSQHLSSSTSSPIRTDHDRVDAGIGGEDSVLRRRRTKIRSKGYKLYSDEDDSPLHSSASSCSEPSPCEQGLFEADEEESMVTAPVPQRSWFAASLIPMYTTQSPATPVADGASMLSGASSRSRIESLVDSISPYEELSLALESGEEERMEKILERLKTEWYCVGASLVALAGLDAAVFGYSSGSIFTIDEFAQSAIACSSIASGLGLLSVSWFVMIYSGADARKFQRLALDVYNTYFFFCISCRLPTVCMSFSALSLTAFLLRVAWRTWRTAVLVMCFVAGVFSTLQYLVYGAHCIVSTVMRIARGIRRGMMAIMGRAVGPAQPTDQEAIAVVITQASVVVITTDNVAAPAGDVAPPAYVPERAGPSTEGASVRTA